MGDKKLFLIIVFFTFITFCTAQKDEGIKTFEIYGLVMTDMGYNLNQINPDYFDVVRPSQLPSYKNQYGTDGNTYFSIRQSSFGVKSFFPTPLGELKTIFEFDLFGLGKNAGQTAFHFRKAFAELGHFGVGQHWSLFVDFDIFPDCLDYWGPNGMALLPNIQVRWMPIMGESRLYVALERPGFSVDQGIYADRIELSGVKIRFPLPDLTAEYRYARKFGYVELAGLLRYTEWEDLNDDVYDLSGNAIGWGLNLTSRLKMTRSVTGKFGVVLGKGIENYMNDGPVDIGIENNFSDPVKPVIGVPLPVVGAVAFFDKWWSPKFSSSIGYSLSGITNSNGQDSSAYKRGQYMLGNLLFYPAEQAMIGVEVQYGSRENYLDGWRATMVKVQFSFRYNFGHVFYRKPEN
jgi:hypothetical protein